MKRVNAAWAMVALLTLASPAVAPAAAEGKDDAKCAYGIALAVSGQAARADSVFVSLLSQAPGDARALTNLGNLRMLEGELDVALVFYEQALKKDPDDAGIRLNRATALMLAGDVEAAEQEAAVGVEQAGGPEKAARLLGLPAENGGGRASDQPFVSKDEIRALLNAATAKVPGDSMRAGAATDSTKVRPTSKKKRTWRSAGPRAGDGGDVAAVLYWKR